MKFEIEKLSDRSVIRAYNSSSQTLTSTSRTTIQFNTADNTNNNGAFTLNSDYTITCNKSMLIDVSAQVYISTLATAGHKDIRIFSNNVQVAESDVYMSSSYSTAYTHTTLKVSEGDVISAAFAGATNDVILGSSSTVTYLSITEL